MALMAADAPAPGLRGDPRAIVRHHLTCTTCGYILRGLRLDAACPECGTAIAAAIEAEHLREARIECSLLERADARWLSTLSHGFLLIFISYLAGAFLFLAAVLEIPFRFADGHPEVMLVPIVPI